MVSLGHGQGPISGRQEGVVSLNYFPASQGLLQLQTDVWWISVAQGPFQRGSGDPWQYLLTRTQSLD